MQKPSDFQKKFTKTKNIRYKKPVIYLKMWDKVKMKILQNACACVYGEKKSLTILIGNMLMELDVCVAKGLKKCLLNEFSASCYFKRQWWNRLGIDGFLTACQPV